MKLSVLAVGLVLIATASDADEPWGEVSKEPYGTFTGEQGIKTTFVRNLTKHGGVTSIQAKESFSGGWYNETTYEHSCENGHYRISRNVNYRLDGSNPKNLGAVAWGQGSPAELIKDRLLQQCLK